MLARSFLMLALLAACATPRTDLGALEPDLLASERRAVQEEAVATALDREARVLRLAWPLVSANALLCHRTAYAVGWRLGDARSVSRLAEGLKEWQVRALGFGDETVVLSVAPGSPAARAGIEAGDVLLSVGGEEEPDLRAISRALSDALEEKDEAAPGPLDVQLRRGEQTVEARIAPEGVCAVRVVASPSGSINASAGFSTLRINAGLVRALPEDNDLAFVIAHELAHVASGHPRKYLQNAAVTGTLLWGPPAVVSAQVLDIVLAPPVKRLGSEAPPLTTAVTQAAAASIGTTDFEAEADYVGLYMLARAGGEVTGMEDVFQLFANVSPRTSWLKITHPTVPERLLRLESAQQEIAARRAAGRPLVPDGWELAED